MNHFRHIFEKQQEEMIFLGLMSGTSLDGLDAVFCTFKPNGNHYSYHILFAETLEYDEEIRSMLLCAPIVSGYELTLYDRKYGRFIGEKINELITRSGISPDIVASHGHTIFHVPDEGVTLQIGHGAAIAAACHLPVVSDFRSLDVALGGQGAPLVPIGDQLLFPDFDACLNLGGFANVSMEKNNCRVAWDICPVNIVANYLAQIKEFDYDNEGHLGASGNMLPDLLLQLEFLDFYRKKYPKSLGREWVEYNVFPLLFSKDQLIEDLLRTFYEHVALRIISDIDFRKGNVLCTGGGVKNRFLMQLIAEKATWTPVIPDPETVNFKESLIFAFLCFLKISGKNNCLASVTGSLRDSASGSLQ